MCHQSIFGGSQRWRSNNVDWKAFREEVDSKVEQFRPTDSLSFRVSRFTDTLKEVAMKVVGKVRPGKRTKVWMTPHVRTLVKKRNQLQRKFQRRKPGDDVQARKTEWVNANMEAKEAIRKAKEDSWKEVVDDAINEKDERKVWKFIKTLNGTPSTNSPNEVMKVNDKVISSNKGKAEEFLKHYASVSRLEFSKEDRNINRKMKQTFRKAHKSQSGEDNSSDFSMRDLKRAISKMKLKSAPGGDDIPPSFLKALGEKALAELLEIFNISLKDADCPQAWRNAIIIPLLKEGKPASQLGSYRPVSLTSCMVKLLERMIAERLYQLAETRNWFNKQQAGFRKGRSCEDQILRMVQAIEDGFQRKPMERSIMVLLDYSKAFDTVWRERLLLSMHEKGVPLVYLRWIRSFLNNRQAKVRFGDALSSFKTIRQGVPQGAVLSPLLFLFYIDNLAKILPQTTTNSLFADDVTVLSTDHSREAAEENAQHTVSIVDTGVVIGSLLLTPQRVR